MWVLWSELLFSYLYSKHFTDLTVFPALSLLTILSISSCLWGDHSQHSTMNFFLSKRLPGLAAFLFKLSQCFPVLHILKGAVLNTEHKALPIAGTAFIPGYFSYKSSACHPLCLPPFTLWCYTPLQETNAYVGSSASSRVSAGQFHQVNNSVSRLTFSHSFITTTDYTLWSQNCL